MRASASVAELAGAELAGADLPRDPADRILVATSRVLGATLVTQDEALVRSELVETL